MVSSRVCKKLHNTTTQVKSYNNPSTQYHRYITTFSQPRCIHIFQFRFQSFNDVHPLYLDQVALVVSVEPAGQNVPVDIHLHQFKWVGTKRLWISLVVLPVVLGSVALEVIDRYDQFIVKFNCNTEIWDCVS